LILYSADSAIARITLNRPDKRNALNPALLSAISEHLAIAERDPSIRAILIDGAGVDFCSGADLSEFAQASEAGVLDHVSRARQIADLFLQIRRHPRPVVAAVKGRALAGGFGLATACDLVLASESARFGYPEVKIGFVPAMVMALLRRSVGEKQAFELLTLGETISAGNAYVIGLVNHVYADDQFDSQVQAFVTALASKSASAVSLSKNLLYQMDGMSFEAALETGVHGNALARMTEDARAGIERFTRKSK
jgi:methylglutaconyl-CoA hydratase